MSRTLNKSQVPFANQFLVSGTATFTNSTNNVSLTGIGSRGIEIGDVVEFSGTVSNDGLYTAEVLTDANNIVFNQAYAGGTTTKSLVNETVSATVTLVAKWFNASVGLGRGNVDVLGSRSTGVTYTNDMPRELFLVVSGGVTGQGAKITVESDGNLLAIGEVPQVSNYGEKAAISVNIEAGSTYTVDTTDGFVAWTELR